MHVRGGSVKKGGNVETHRDGTLKSFYSHPNKTHSNIMQNYNPKLLTLQIDL